MDLGTWDLWVWGRGCPALVLPLKSWASPPGLLRRVVGSGLPPLPASALLFLVGTGGFM